MARSWRFHGELVPSGILPFIRQDHTIKSWDQTSRGVHYIEKLISEATGAALTKSVTRSLYLLARQFLKPKAAHWRHYRTDPGGG